MELQILDWIQMIRTPFGDVAFPLISKLGNAGAVWLLLGGVLLIYPKTRKSGAILMLALCVDAIVTNGILKPLIARIRPCDVNTAIKLLIPKPNDFSFPSGHTAASFAAVAALYLAGEKKLWKPALVLAVLIAFSRMYLYVHYPSDILGGIVVGIVSGYAGSLVVKMVSDRRERNRNGRSCDTGL